MIRRPDLTAAILIQADLSGADLHGADLRGADLRANLSNADLSSANLISANVRDADLSNANLTGAKLSHADLMGAKLNHTDLYNAVLEGANLKDTSLLGAHLFNTVLRGADLNRAVLCSARLSHANLKDARLQGTNLDYAILEGADLSGADLSGAGLIHANLKDARLQGANLSHTHLGETIFGNVGFTGVIGLETCKHQAPSVIDHRTLQNSGPLPLAFLRGVGLPDNLIDYLPSLLNQAIQHYSCFISYSAKDDDFAKRIHADLQNSGVRCWFAPHDMPIGGKIRDEIDAAIRLRDKVMLVLSKHSILSTWVEDEVDQAFEEEQKRGQVVLFPVRLDDEVKATDKPWASKLRRARHIGDFTHWKDHDAYKQSFERVVRDLTVKAKVS
jgi:uncharacterized protein YjbI with pentapeptide repeats